MHRERVAAIAAVCVLVAAASTTTAQVPTEGEHNADLSGVWTGVNLPGTAEWAINTFSERAARDDGVGQGEVRRREAAARRRAV